MRWQAIWVAAVLALGGGLAAPSARATGEHAAEGEHGTGAGHGEHAEPELNWYHGLIYESGDPDVQPSLVVRPHGMPAPFLASLINASVLFFLLVHFGKGPVAEGLRKRRVTILQGIDEASVMREDAAQQLKKYEDKLARIDEEIERVRREMREAAEQERARILTDAKSRRERMETDVKLLIEQELKAAREQLLRETARSAVSSAEELLKKHVGLQDQQRVSDQLVKSIRASLINARGGRA